MKVLESAAKGTGLCRPALTLATETELHCYGGETYGRGGSKLYLMPLVNVPGAGVQNLPEEQAAQYSPPIQRGAAHQNTNLTPPWPKGVSGNPGGKAKTLTLAAVLREDKDLPYVMAARLKRVILGDNDREALLAIREAADRLYGTSVSQLHVVTEDSTAVSLQAQYLEALRERLGLPAPTTVDGSVVHHNEAEPPQSPQPTQPPTSAARKRGRPRGSVDKQARKARTD